MTRTAPQRAPHNPVVSGYSMFRVSNNVRLYFLNVHEDWIIFLIRNEPGFFANHYYSQGPPNYIQFGPFSYDDVCHYMNILQTRRSIVFFMEAPMLA